MLEQLIQAYGYAGPIDSVVAMTRRLVAINSSDMTPVIRAIQALGSATRYVEMIELGAFIEQYGNPDDKQNYAGLLLQAAQPMIGQTPQDWPLIASLARKAVSLLPADSQVSISANYFLGVSTFFQIPPLDQQVEAAKSCEMAQQMRSLLDEAGPALTAGRSIAEQQVSQWLGYVEQLRPRIASLNTAYCR
jgi:hypothetical protein